MTSLLRQVDHWRASGLLAQLARFGVAGAVSSLVYSAVYLALSYTVFPGSCAVFAVPFAFVVAVTVSFLLHSRWSFKGHGTRDEGFGQHLKFLTVQGAGLALNTAIIWIGTALLHLQPWVPLVPAILLAAIVSFLLNRLWVFG